ncbi:MAG TPA: hypothetical protein VF950_09595 [Planctomycetota bacterium]
MARFLVLGLAAAALPACGENKIRVDNAGTGEARVYVSYYTHHEEPITGYSWSEREHDSWIVGPGQAGEQEYPSSALEVTITREPGGAVLYAADLTYDDFRDEHSRIEVTVFP